MLAKVDPGVQLESGKESCTWQCTGRAACGAGRSAPQPLTSKERNRRKVYFRLFLLVLDAHDCRTLTALLQAFNRDDLSINRDENTSGFESREHRVNDTFLALVLCLQVI